MTDTTDFLNKIISNPNGPSEGWCESKGEYYSLFLGNSYDCNHPRIEIRMYSLKSSGEPPLDFEGINISNQGAWLRIEITKPASVIECDSFEIVLNHV